MNIVLLDFVRLIAVSQAAFVILATLVILVRYAPLIKSAADKPKRILVWHILLIGISYIGAIVSITVDMLARYGVGMSWRLPLAFFVFTTGDFALLLMFWRVVIQRRILQIIEESRR